MTEGLTGLVEHGEARCPISLTSRQDCGNDEMVEVERDGDHEYFECPECGFAWGWRFASDGVRIDADCQAGVPLEVRAAAGFNPQTDPQAVDG